LGGFHATHPEVSYAQWPMGNEAFVTTNNPAETIKKLAEMGLDSRLVGELEEAKDERTGVELEAFNGETVYFSGR